MNATIFTLPPELRRHFCFIKQDHIPALCLFFEGKIYNKQATVPTAVPSAEDAAEEMFDLTNNPSRQDERELLYGRGPSVSTGDIVEVEQGEQVTRWLCMDVGWVQLDVANHRAWVEQALPA